MHVRGPIKRLLSLAETLIIVQLLYLYLSPLAHYRKSENSVFSKTKYNNYYYYWYPLNETILIMFS